MRNNKRSWLSGVLALVLVMSAGSAFAQLQFNDSTVSVGLDGEVYTSTNYHALGPNFIDFNNDLGEKGYPKFEFVRL